MVFVNYKKIAAIAVGVCLSFSIQAQNKVLQKTEGFVGLLDKLYETTEPENGLKRSKDVANYFKRKYPTSSDWNALPKAYNAAYYSTLGQFSKSAPLVGEINNLLMSEDSVAIEHMYLTNILLKIYLQEGRYVEAEKLSNKFRAYSDTLKNTKVKNEFAINYTKLLTEQAYLKKAADFIGARLSEKQDSVFKKKSQYKDWRSQRIEMQLEALKVSYLMGNHAVVSPALEILKKQAEKEIGFHKGVMAKIQYAQGKNAFDMNKFEDAENLLTKASGSSLKYFKTYSPLYFKINKLKVDAMREQGMYEDAQVLNNDLDIKTLDYFGKKSATYVQNTIIDIEKYMFRQNYNLAEKELEKLLADTVRLPINHMLRATVLEHYYVCTNNNNHADKTAKSLVDYLKLKETMHGIESPAYNIGILEEAKYQFQIFDHFEDARSKYSYALHGIIEQECGLTSKYYHDNLLVESDLLLLTGRFNEAKKLLKEFLEKIEKINGKENYFYVSTSLKRIQIELMTGNYKEVEEDIRECISILEKPEFKVAYKNALADTYFLNANFHMSNGHLEYAQDYFSKSYNLKKKFHDNPFKRSPKTKEEILLNILLGKYQKSKDVLTTLIEEKSKKLGSKHHSLVELFHLRGNLYTLTGHFSEAEQDLHNAYDIITEVFGDKSSYLSENYALTHKLQMSIGDYEKAEAAIRKAYNLNKDIFGEKNVITASTMHELALTSHMHITAQIEKTKNQLNTQSGNGGKNERGINVDNDNKKQKNTEDKLKKSLLENDALVKNSLDNIANLIGKDNPAYAEALENAAIYNLKNNRLAEAEKYLTEAEAIYVKVFGKEHLKVADISYKKGSLKYQLQKYQEALDAFKASMENYKNIFNDQHPGYISAQGMAARMHYILGNKSEAVSLMESSVDKTLIYLDKIFPGLSDREKTKYWDKVKADFEFYNNLVFSGEKVSNSMVEKSFDLTMRTKAILLNNSLKVRQAILTSGDTSLILTYNVWSEKKDQLIAAYAMNANQRKTEGIDINKLEQEIESLDRKLSKSSKDFAQSNTGKKAMTWKSLKKNLKTGEVAMEVIAFPYFTNRFTDTVYYVAMFVAPNTNAAPGYVLLKNGKELETRYLKYLRNSVIFMSDDDYSYDQYWSQIEKAIPANTKTIYMSADGVYNQINLETLKKSDGNYLIDLYTVVNIGSTRDLLNRVAQDKSKKQDANNSVLMIGNPLYYTSSVPLDKQKIAQLPGTEAEVNFLKNLMESNKYSVSTLMKEEATEQKIKDIKSPKILHIATHGFFLPDGDASDMDEVSEKAVQNPLLRSGLLFRDGGEIIQNEKVYAFNKRDGILTAFEIMNMNFDKTDIVVMSACETGLGEVKSGEGVYGLQRAFILAGANNLVMSLFKVNDEVTVMLMSEFYKGWSGGLSKRDAFVKAKKAVREKFAQPKYWGSFILIGL